MEIDDNLIGLEVLILSKELSAEEYFTIVVSTCENDLRIAKFAVANVLKKIKPNEVTYQKLKTLHNEFFQEEFCFEEQVQAVCKVQDPDDAKRTDEDPPGVPDPEGPFQGQVPQGAPSGHLQGGLRGPRNGERGFKRVKRQGSGGEIKSYDNNER